MAASKCGQQMPQSLGDANLRSSESSSRESPSSGADTSILPDAKLELGSALELPLWKLYWDFEERKCKLDMDSQYIRENYGKIKEMVRCLGMSFSDFDNMPPSELRKRTDLPPEVIAFLVRVEEGLAHEQEIRIVWATVKRRTSEMISGLAAFLCLDGLAPSGGKTH